ncbi:hypothetical protein BP00DRAFT_456892 [Aspergillus indologenus CBS 114.80]|uniref:Uncharacterized protein n=1 Tax=Aspergillus indologenus CBS 114.80 TaxID=1450541 RepID=A0A2V5J9N9_9EURO|nr:hypothetical protein BP00DRAFT_456892 [Aspergillus indologenus CBS 114.80]
MYFSIGQQLMRQDPAYYLLYVLARPDHNWKLVSYPYYAKFAQPGDSTFFRHIDINILRAVEGMLRVGRRIAQMLEKIRLVLLITQTTTNAPADAVDPAAVLPPRTVTWARRGGVRDQGMANLSVKATGKSPALTTPANIKIAVEHHIPHPMPEWGSETPIWNGGIDDTPVFVILRGLKYDVGASMTSGPVRVHARKDDTRAIEYATLCDKQIMVPTEKSD